METRQVNGEDVLVPVVYLGSSSLDRIAAGGAVIAGKDVTVTATGDMQNAGVLVADNGLTITADTIFNTRGTMSGQDVTLAATDSILNAGGTVHGDTVSLTAVNDVISASDTVTFTSPTVTATHIGKQGAITADGDLTVVAGKNIGVFGSDMAAGGDAKLAAGNSVIVSTQALETHAKTTGKGSRSHTDVTTNHGASITAGGSLTVDAGGSVTVHGSQMKAGDDLSVKAGGGVSVTSAADTVDYYDHSSGKSGGLFGGKKSHTAVRQDTTNVASQLESGGDMTMEAGTSGKGAATISGSRLTSGDDISVTAADDVLVTSVTDQHYAQDDEQKKGAFTSKMALDETRKIDVVRSELDAKGDVLVESRTGDVTVKASHLRAEGGVDIKAEQGSVALLTDKELSYERHVSSDMGWLTWSSRDKGTSAETVLHTLIESGENISITARDGVTVEYHHTGDARADVRQLAKTPGLEWMAGLLERDDVDWRAVQAVYDTWDHKDGGLGPAAMLVIAIAASVATYGAASQLSMSMMGLAPGTIAGKAAIIVVATGKAATATTLAMQTALTAAFVSLSSQMATGLANAAAGGDFKDTLNSIVSEDGARSLLASMVLAGTLDYMKPTLQDYTLVKRVLTVAAVKASVGTIVKGQALETAFTDALGTAFSSYAAGLISTAELDKTIEIVLAGATGAAAAAITGEDPTMAAMGAIVATLADAMTAKPLTEEQKAKGRLYGTLSKCAYGEGQCENVNGYEKMSADQLDAIGIKSEMLKDERNGFEATVFYNKADKKYVVAFRGTDLTSKVDWQSSIAQAFGKVGDQYQSVALLSQTLSRVADRDGATLVATGHSLGGGLASALAAKGFVKEAYTFNAAGLHDNTIAAIVGNDPKSVADAKIDLNNKTKAYMSTADVLSNIQDLFSLVVPTAAGQRILVDGGSWHTLDGMLNAFGPAIKN
ncbi:hemagglutinin repeat-containing protein [Nitratidesulfovibrio termitidis]|uniref:hemagglutinin repeat-containing protein n=1 Tax=Nitratidesulfovibrio termitidis TaxID=42252 RepID=UPI00040B4482|nr:hemagglutinin repeat-containing protein [Nitratidesulfovibrio termitidis]